MELRGKTLSRYWFIKRFSEVIIIRYTQLGKTGKKVFRLGFGTMGLHANRMEESKEAVEIAIEYGINYFDTAAAYGKSEEILGECLKGKRQEVFIATKTGRREAVGAELEIERSLKRLQTDCIDLIQIHYVNRQNEFDKIISSGGALEAAIKAKKEGKVRFIGISGHRPELLKEWIGTGIFDTVLFHVNLAQNFATLDLLPFAKNNGIGTIGMKPLSGGMLKPQGQAIRYSYSTEVDVVLSGMRTKEEVIMNLGIIEAEIDIEEKLNLSKLADELSKHGCRRCNYCSCPIGIPIPDLMISSDSFQRYGLLEKGSGIIENSNSKLFQCSTYEPCQIKPLCQIECPYELSIQSKLMSYIN